MLAFDKTSNKKKYLIIVVAALYLFFSCFYVLLCHRNLANTNLFSSGNSISQNVHFVNKPINSPSSITHLSKPRVIVNKIVVIVCGLIWASCILFFICNKLVKVHFNDGLSFPIKHVVIFCHVLRV
ncbi:MAG: hypothetical protein JWP44_2999 [Mucilaginibacter sp.]|nr:hypothetical protein [Mucilaginibacter sp.]